ncbi:hypothetical protein OA000_00370 [bacterium]|nr:hypothetical protein [bacterium]
MHRYFLIPFIGFFIIVSIFVFFLQFINEDWKFIAPKVVLPKDCDNNVETSFIIYETDKKINRSFKDKLDLYEGNQFHPIYLLPCERDDREYDINNKIESSLLAINYWLKEQTISQEIKFDRNIDGNIDITFLRVNKTMDWFGDLHNRDKTKNITEVSDKIEKLINDNSNLFNNFSSKKFIIFFEGWEKRKYIDYDICGKSRFDGNIAIYYTYSRFKKYIGDDLILSNNERIFSCTHKDHLNDNNDKTFGDAEATILHEMIHALGFPTSCAKNNKSFHVADNKNDIMHKNSGKIYLDYNNDDYYNHQQKNCPDLKNNNFLQ